MSRLATAWIATTVLYLTCCGCMTRPPSIETGVIVFVPGVSGDGPWYDGLKNGIRDGGVTMPIESFGWGAPAPLFMLNFNTVSIHDSAEQKLAARLTALCTQHPAATIVVVTHSAGGGVALGALKRLKDDLAIDRVVLLHPSVSPTYELALPLARVRRGITLFSSVRDTTFLQWRTSNFGTYDNIKTVAAGNCGFEVGKLGPELTQKLTQVPYNADFALLGNDGGHFGPTARQFAREQVAPLLTP